MSQPTGPRVFISYSHDSPEHRDRILVFAKKLQDAGIKVWLDQFEETVRTSPANGWAAWSEKCLRDADKVLIVCTEKYQQCYFDEAPTREGHGVRWEGCIIRNQLYRQIQQNHKFAVLLFAETDADFIPDTFSSLMKFLPLRADSQTRLLNWLRSQPVDIAPGQGPVSIPQELPPGTHSEPEAAVLVILDVKDFTPLSINVGAQQTSELADEFQRKVEVCCDGLGFQIVEGLGDAFLLHGEHQTAVHLPELMLRVFGIKGGGIRTLLEHPVALRMVATFGYVTVKREHGRPIKMFGETVIRLFRLEKQGEVGQLLITNDLHLALAHKLKPEKIEKTYVLLEHLKGFLRSDDLHESETRVEAWRLIPPRPAPKRDGNQADLLKARLDELREKVSRIRLLANLWPPISMKDNFIELRLETGEINYRRRTEVKRERDWHDGDDVAESRDRVFTRHDQSLKPSELYDQMPTAFIVGLPGAGKTTILRHFGYFA